MEVFSLLKLKKSRGSSFDDGPFFDLEFSAAGDNMTHRLSSSSPFLSEEIFFNGRLFTLQSSSNSFSVSEPNSMPQSTSRVRKVSKDVILRCISKIKPFYTKVSNLGFSGPTKNGFSEKQSHLKAGFPIPGRLRKSRSASSAVASVISPIIVAPRRDDSLLQQEDGIQSAIAHCKRSFHSNKGFGGAELQPMVRSMSDPGGERNGGSSAY